ncbi:MAG: cytochrome c maturation protein CcmE [Solirubrobacteraceae bacterium]|nr:cytochrome c maturation protein CcmE [Solirubrobacteraceae bacterium]
MQVSRSRRRTVRFVVALTLAVALSGALVYTTFSVASPERFPSQIATAADPEQTYRVGGHVIAGSVSRKEGVLRFKLGHPGTGAGEPINVVYNGTVPDPFREGRDVIIDVKQGAGGEAAQFVGQGNSLVTKCPSKFNGEPFDQNRPAGAEQVDGPAAPAPAAS